MKKHMSLMLSFVIMFCMTLPVFATADPALEVIEIEYYADGSYGVISLKNEPGRAPTGTVTKTKTYEDRGRFLVFVYQDREPSPVFIMKLCCGIT